MGFAPKDWKRGEISSTRLRGLCEVCWKVTDKALRPCDLIVYNNRLGVNAGCLLGPVTLKFKAYCDFWIH